MRKLIVLLVLAGGLVGADFAAKSYAEGRVADRIESGLRGQVQAEADIDSFPFLGRLLLASSAGDVHARVTGVTAGPRLRFSVVRVALREVQVDRDLLFQKQVSITDIDSGTAVLEVGAEELSTALDVPVEMRGGVVEATVGGRPVRARVSIEAGSLRLAVDPLPALSVPVPRTALAPCDGDAEVVGDRLRITCTFEEVPPALVRAARTRPTAPAGGAG